MSVAALANRRFGKAVIGSGAVGFARCRPPRSSPPRSIGSYPQPDWLIDRERLRGSLPPRVRARELWRIAEPYLAQAQDDATALAIADQERAGVDIVTDGEIRRESYSNRFATALEGLDIDNPAMVPGRAGGRTRCRAWSARCAARGRSRSRTCASCAAAPTARSRSRCPARSR